MIILGRMDGSLPIDEGEVIDTVCTGILPPERFGEYYRVRIVNAPPGRRAFLVGSYLITNPHLHTAVLTAAKVTVFRGISSLWH